ncbi:receptor-like protein EIX2, partial [Tanacetum coccineum]
FCISVQKSRVDFGALIQLLGFTIVVWVHVRFGLASGRACLRVCVSTRRGDNLVTSFSFSVSLFAGVYEVGCDRRNGHVVKLDLRSPISFTGEIVKLYTGNSLRGDIPEFMGSFKRLRYLNLSLRLWGCSPSSSRKSLKIIPFRLSNLTGLMHINLQSNYFHGRIPDFLGTLNAFASIDLSKNSFNTQMPDLFWNLSSLVRLDLSSNMFHEYYQWKPSKYYLLLSQNSFSGPLPPSLSISSLKELDISINRLNGSIPASFGLPSRLECLEFWYNQLSGSIPMSLGKLSNLKKVDISYNSLSGIVSETHFIGLKNLTFLQFSSNLLELNVSSGWIPPFQLQRFSASSCNVGPHFPNWLKTQTNLQFLDLSYSSLVGTLPPFHGSIPESQLMMNSNKFEGSLASFPSNVQLLDLSDNFLSGNVPQTNGTLNPGLIGRLPGCLGNLISLQAIDTNNMISGVVPSSLGNNFFKGPIPFWIGEKLSNLRILNLQSNKFKGKIPQQFCRLEKLQLLSLAQKKITGMIPHCFGNISGMI